MTCKVTTRQEAGQHQFQQLVLGVGTRHLPGWQLKNNPGAGCSGSFGGQSSMGKQLFPV